MKKKVIRTVLAELVLLLCGCAHQLPLLNQVYFSFKGGSYETKTSDHRL